MYVPALWASGGAPHTQFRSTPFVSGMAAAAAAAANILHLQACVPLTGTSSCRHQRGAYIRRLDWLQEAVQAIANHSPLQLAGSWTSCSSSSALTGTSRPGRTPRAAADAQSARSVTFGVAANLRSVIATLQAESGAFGNPVSFALLCARLT
jgi:hypothetical protein